MRLALFLLAASVANIVPVIAAPQPITFTTTDNLTLHAHLQPATTGQPTLLLLHGLGASKEEWSPLQKKAHELGWGYLAYDARGHGASSLEKDKNGNAIGYQKMGYPGPGSQWEKMIDDVGAALRYLEKEQGVDRKSIVLGGASLGANVALNFAALSGRVKGVILLSPGINYQEVQTEGAIKKASTIPILIVASPIDRYAFGSAQRLKSINPKLTLWTDVREGHGVQMLDEALLTRLTQWIQKQK